MPKNLGFCSKNAQLCFIRSSLSIDSQMPFSSYKMAGIVLGCLFSAQALAFFFLVIKIAYHYGFFVLFMKKNVKSSGRILCLLSSLFFAFDVIIQFNQKSFPKVLHTIIFNIGSMNIIASYIFFSNLLFGIMIDIIQFSETAKRRFIATIWAVATFFIIIGVAFSILISLNM